MKKHLFAMAALLLLASGAQATSQTYVLSSVTNFNSFAPLAPVASCTGCGSATAVDDGLGNIALAGIAWSYNAGGNQYTISFDGTTTLALGTTLAKAVSPAPTCVNITGTVCTAGPLSGMGGLAFYTGIGSDNLTACINDRCRVDVSTSGSNLVIAIKRALSESPTSFNSQTYTLTFAAVPLPAGVWLFGSALGLMGLARRKVALS